LRGGGVPRREGGVGALAASAVEDAGAVGAIGGPDRLDLGTDAGLGALQAGFVQHQRAPAGGDGADDPVCLWRLIAMPWAGALPAAQLGAARVARVGVHSILGHRLNAACRAGKPAR
jgi:hypothetical protein